MSRQARQKSESGIYHVILRGINKQEIFEDDEDRQKYIDCLQYYKSVCQYSLYGYCLMDNHIHLLIKEGKEPLGHTMKRIGVSYVAWYNRKYNRYGHLFHDRFKSEVVESDEYLLAVLRYIHQNPLEGGTVKDLAAYKWSSYREYIGEGKIVDTDFVTGIFAQRREQALGSFEKFMNENGDVSGLEINEPKRLTDQEVKIIIQKYADVRVPAAVQNMEKGKRDEILRRMKQIDGVSTRQIARLTGISQSVIARA